MTTTTKTSARRLRFHQNAYQFVFAALRHTQQKLGRGSRRTAEAESHISGQELLEGVRDLGLEQFGLMAAMVFRHWGVRTTADFGRIVFELIERGEMRKTDRDQLEDFFDVYDFEEALDQNYRIDTRQAFGR
jgi:uncharacterized repeat protein (TIGR04138 family)